MFRTAPRLGTLTTAAALFAQPAGRLDLGRLQTGAAVSFTRSAAGDGGIEISGSSAPRVLQTQPAKVELYRADDDVRQLSVGYKTVRKMPSGVDARAEIAYGDAAVFRVTKDEHYLDVARVLLHDTKFMVALPGRQYDVKGFGWQQEGWRMGPGASRGVGGHRYWLPWVSANQVYGIAGLEEYDPVLFKKLSNRPGTRGKTGSEIGS